MELKDLEVALEKAKREIESRFSPEAVEAQRRAILAGLEAVYKKKEEDFKILLEAMPFDVLSLLERGAIFHITKVIERNKGEYDALRIEWQNYDLTYVRQHIKTFSLPEGRWRLLIFALPVLPKEQLNEWDLAGLKR